MKNLKKTRLIRISAALLAVIMLCSLVACKKKYSDPTEQFVAAIEKLTAIKYNEKSGKDSTAQLDIDAFDNKQVSVTLQPVISDTLITMLGAELPFDVSVINNASIGIDAALKDEIAKLGLSLGYANSAVLAASGILDIANLGAYVNISAGSAKPLFFDLKSLLESVDADVLGQINTSSSLTADEAKQLGKIINDYVKMTYAGVSGVEAGEESYSVGELSADVTSLTWNATDKVVYDTAIAIAEKFVADQNLKTLLSKAFGASYPEFDEEYADLVDEVKEFLESEKSDPTVMTNSDVLTVILYVDKNNDVMGIDVVARDTDGTVALNFNSGSLKVGDDFAFEMTAYGEDFAKMSLTAHGTNVKDIVNGTISVSYDGKQIAAITLKDCDSSKADKGIYKGVIHVRPGSGLSSLPEIEPTMAIAIGMFGLNVEFDVKEDEADYFLSVEMNSANLAGIKLHVENGAVDVITVPTDYVSEPIVWAMSLDFNAILTAIDNSELPDEIVNIIRSLLSQQ